MTDREQAIGLLVDALDDLNYRCEAPHAYGKIDQALALLREKPELTALSEQLRRLSRDAIAYNLPPIHAAADLLDRQALEIDQLKHDLADANEWIAKAKEG